MPCGCPDRLPAESNCVREEGIHDKDWEQKKEEQHTRKHKQQGERSRKEQAQTQAEQILCIEQSPPNHFFLSINPPLINQTPLSRAKQRR